MISHLEDISQQYGIMSETLLHSAIPLFWSTKDHFIITNHAFVELTGLREDELLKRGFDDLSFPGKHQLKLNEIFTSDERQYKIFTWVLQEANQEPLSIELRLTQFSLAGRFYYFGMVRQHSPDKKEQSLFLDDLQHLHLVLSASGQGLWDWNLAEDRTTYSSEYFEMLGYVPNAFDPDYDSWANLLHSDDAVRAIAIWEEFELGGRDVYKDEFRLRRVDGSFVWVYSEGRVVQRDENGGAIRVLGTVRNINERKQDELKIKEQSQRLIDYAFFNSHRLRGPLTSIMGLTAMLKDEYNEKAIDLLEKVSHELDSVVGEINDVLVGDDSADRQWQQLPIKKVSLIDKSRIIHMVYKKTFERYLDHVELTTYDRAMKALHLLQNKTLNTDMVLLDVESAFDIWGFLDEYNTQMPDTPVYLLAKNVNVDHAVRAAKYKCIRGFLLKPVDREKLINLIRGAVPV